MRWKITLTVVLMFLLTALPFTVMANGAITDPLDFSSFSEDKSGAGWSWNNDSKTLTLSGIEMDLSGGTDALILPDGATIVLTEGTENRITNNHGGAILGQGSLEVTGEGNLYISANVRGIYNDAGDFRFIDCGEISVSTVYGSGIEAWGDITISGCEKIDLRSGNNCIYGQDGVGISNCGEIKLLSEEGDGIVTGGNIDISGCAMISIAGSNEGIHADGNINLTNCPAAAIEATCEYIGGDGLENPKGCGIYAYDGGVTITGSTLTVSGAYFGIATGLPYASGSGGDININQSTVHASCSDGGFAAIYAGDDLSPGDEGDHAQIVLNGCAIIIPAGGRVIDVNIESASCVCQSITALPDITAITSWGQAAKAVTIGSPSYCTYDANGGSGSMADLNNPYFKGTAVTVLPYSFTAPAGRVFSGWNTEADGSGRSYAPGDTFVIAGDTTLYAQYAPVFTVTFDSQGGSAVAAVAAQGNSTIAAPAEPTRKSYTFGGWYRDKDCKNAWNFASDRVTGDLTLYAKWTPSGQLPPTGGQSFAEAVMLIALCLLGSLFLLIRRRQHV